MSRSRTRRTLRDIHGPEVEILEAVESDGPGVRWYRATPRRRNQHLGFRLVLGVLGFFWTLVLGVLVLMMTVAGVVFLKGAFFG